MDYPHYTYPQCQSKAQRLHTRIAWLERENTNLENLIRRKDDRIHQLETALETMRRELHYVQDGHRLDQAKRQGQRAIGGIW